MIETPSGGLNWPNLLAKTVFSPRFLVYARNGNRQAETEGASTKSYGYTPATNRLVNVDGTQIGRDAVGSRSSDQGGGRAFTYNSRGRLSQVSEAGQVVATYRYDAAGRRSQKVTSAGTVVYHYDTAGTLLAETDGTGALIREYIRYGSMPLAQIDVVSGSERMVWLHSDHLGTVRFATNDAGTRVWQWSNTDPFGANAGNEDPDGDGTTTQVSLRFPGQYYDQETGLHYNYFRYYDPAVGRYITSDPIGLSGGGNTYGYVSANPLRSSDPLGMFEIVGGTPAQRERLQGYGDSLQERMQSCNCDPAFQDVFNNWKLVIIDQKYETMGDLSPASQSIADESLLS